MSANGTGTETAELEGKNYYSFLFALAKESLC